MRSITLLLENVGVIGATELACSVQEEDWQRGQTYSARWRSLRLLGPRQQDRQEVSEWDPRRGHTFARQWEARNLLMRYLPGGALWKDPTTKPQPPIRLPLLGARASQAPVRELVCCQTMPQRSVVVMAVAGKKEKDVTTAVPLTESSFDKMQKSLGRVLSQEAQRG